MSVVQTAWQFIFHNSTPLGAPKPICSQDRSTSLLKDLQLFLNQAAATNGHAMYLHSTSFRNLSKFKKKYKHVRVVLNSFIWKTSSSPKKILSPNFRELHVFLSRYMLAKIFKKNVDVWYPQIVPGVWSLVTLHSAAAALKHLRSALRCWSLLTFIGQFWHNKSTV